MYPDLDFETASGRDLGYERRLPDRGIFGINLFYRDISDLIGLVNTGLPVSDIGLDPEDFPGSLYTYRNIGDARVHGVELDLSTPLAFKIGRASCRERVCQYGLISVVAGS